ncbi:MAG TPA: SDR family oxidoreductase [Polyangiales bacterium]
MSDAAQPLSIRQSLAGRHVFLTGGSGFLGKVWLSMVLTHLPEVARIYVFLRPKALVPARQRFEKMINTSPAFRPLHERFGARLGEHLAQRVEVVEGELSAPDLGLRPELVRRLRRDLDVMIHCAGLVDFNPDLRKALGSNVDATTQIGDFVARCDHATLLHISTCYVAGGRHGQIDEALPGDTAPCGEQFPVEAELSDARAAVDAIVCAHDHEDERRLAREDVLADLAEQGRVEQHPRVVDTLVRKRQRERLKQALVDEGMRRAKRWGWPNTYTYTKSMAERLLARRADKLRFSVLRPSIVESALEFPFPGWNESFNGSAPLAYLMGTWFRMVPAKPDAPFDVIPVDLVCKAMTIATAALVAGRHQPVYHIGSSDRNRCTVGRAAELIVLAHRRHFRERHRSRQERVLKSRWDAVLVEPDALFGIKNNRAVVRAWQEALDLLPDKLRKKAEPLAQRAKEVDEGFAQIEMLVELYLPFMYECFYVFVSRALDTHPAQEPEFAYPLESLDWRKYWLDVHMPGLRRWAFPLIDGKRPERYRSEHPVRLSEASAARGDETSLHSEHPLRAVLSEV